MSFRVSLVIVWYRLWSRTGLLVFCMLTVLSVGGWWYRSQYGGLSQSSPEGSIDILVMPIQSG